jgi:hypothetical protein
MAHRPVIPVVPQKRPCWRYKLCHTDFEDAVKHARHICWLDQRRDPGPHPRYIVIYFCTTHQSWHVGHERVSRVGVPPGQKETSTAAKNPPTVEVPKQ